MARYRIGLPSEVTSYCFSLRLSLKIKDNSRFMKNRFFLKASGIQKSESLAGKTCGQTV
jgi:hypothetical protein